MVSSVALSSFSSSISRGIDTTNSSVLLSIGTGSGEC